VLVPHLVEERPAVEAQRLKKLPPAHAIAASLSISVSCQAAEMMSDLVGKAAEIGQGVRNQVWLVSWRRTWASKNEDLRVIGGTTTIWRSFSATAQSRASVGTVVENERHGQLGFDFYRSMLFSRSAHSGPEYLYTVFTMTVPDRSDLLAAFDDASDVPGLLRRRARHELRRRSHRAGNSHDVICNFTD